MPTPGNLRQHDRVFETGSLPRATVAGEMGPRLRRDDIGEAERTTEALTRLGALPRGGAGFAAKQAEAAALGGALALGQEGQHLAFPDDELHGREPVAPHRLVEGDEIAADRRHDLRLALLAPARVAGGKAFEGQRLTVRSDHSGRTADIEPFEHGTSPTRNSHSPDRSGFSPSIPVPLRVL